MALPKITTPTYTLDKPSTGEKVDYRPFLVGEEKILLMAMESEEESEELGVRINSRTNNTSL